MTVQEKIIQYYEYGFTIDEIIERIALSHVDIQYVRRALGLKKDGYRRDVN